MTKLYINMTNEEKVLTVLEGMLSPDEPTRALARTMAKELLTNQESPVFKAVKKQVTELNNQIGESNG